MSSALAKHGARSHTSGLPHRASSPCGAEQGALDAARQRTWDRRIMPLRCVLYGEPRTRHTTCECVQHTYFTNRCVFWSRLRQARAVTDLNTTQRTTTRVARHTARRAQPPRRGSDRKAVVRVRAQHFHDAAHGLKILRARCFSIPLHILSQRRETLGLGFRVSVRGQGGHLEHDHGRGHEVIDGERGNEARELPRKVRDLPVVDLRAATVSTLAPSSRRMSTP